MNNKATEFIEKLGQDHDLVVAESAMDMYDELRELPEEEREAKKDQILKDELRRDPIADAEKEMGLSYKDPNGGDAVAWEGMSKMWASSARKTEILKGRRDTLFSSPLDYYQEVIEENGFEKVLEIPFHSWDKDESFFVYWHPDGLLLCFDTFGSDKVNGGKVYYNWETTNRERDWRITSSYSPVECSDEGEDYYFCLAGDHDCREALIHNINQLRENGNFLKIWRKKPFLWFLHHGDKDENGKVDHYEDVNAERIAMLPQHVQDAIKGTEE
jgi:hypothetical protein